MTSPVTRSVGLGSVARLLGYVDLYPRGDGTNDYCWIDGAGGYHTVSRWDLAGAIIEKMRGEPNSELRDKFHLAVTDCDCDAIWEINPELIILVAAAYEEGRNA
jgi:hypothetical protein